MCVPSILGEGLCAQRNHFTSRAGWSCRAVSPLRPCRESTCSSFPFWVWTGYCPFGTRSSAGDLEAFGTATKHQTYRSRLNVALYCERICTICRGALLLILRGESAPSLSSVARQLNLSVSHLAEKCPELCRTITLHARTIEYRKRPLRHASTPAPCTERRRRFAPPRSARG
jgi:hypothetical protein